MVDNTGMEFMEAVVEDDGPGVGETRTRILEAQNGMELEVELYGPDRDEIFDKLQQLPDELLEVLTEEDIDDPEEAQAEADEAELLQGMSGDAIRAFEEICALGMRHPGELTTHHIEELVRELDLEVLFPFGVEVIEMALDNSGAIEDFREPE